MCPLPQSNPTRISPPPRRGRRVAADRGRPFACGASHPPARRQPTQGRRPDPSPNCSSHHKCAGHRPLAATADHLRAADTATRRTAGNLRSPRPADQMRRDQPTAMKEVVPTGRPLRRSPPPAGDSGAAAAARGTGRRRAPRRAARGADGARGTEQRWSRPSGPSNASANEARARVERGAAGAASKSPRPHPGADASCPQRCRAAGRRGEAGGGVPSRCVLRTNVPDGITRPRRGRNQPGA